ncbi:MAG: hypothetical protein WCY88_13390 [Spongiibacteraceae bacterium]
MSDAYSVVVTGKVASGFELAQVKNNVGKLFKLKEEQLEKLFSGKPVAIRRDLEKGQALKMRAALAKAGALAAVTISKPAITKNQPTKTPITHQAPVSKASAPKAVSAKPAPVVAATSSPAAAQAKRGAAAATLNNNTQALRELISCPRCGHEQSYSDNCSMCQVDLRLQHKRLKRKQQLQAFRGQNRR